MSKPPGRRAPAAVVPQGVVLAQARPAKRGGLQPGATYEAGPTAPALPAAFKKAKTGPR